jgi:hypothetical protein
MKKSKVAWEKFKFSGKIEDYLYYKELKKKE